jgi:hypothetical protein
MERVALRNLLTQLKTPTRLTSFTTTVSAGTNAPMGITANLYSSDGSFEEKQITGLAPFHTIEDIQRAIWLQNGESDDLFPKFCFVGVETVEGTFESIAGFYQGIDQEQITLPNPLDVIRQRRLQDKFVEADGQMRAVAYTSTTRITIETKYKTNEGQTVPTLHVFPFRILRSIYPDSIISEQFWNGLFRPYFPLLENSDSAGALSAVDREQAKQMKEELQTKLAQTKLLNVLAVSPSADTTPEVSASAVRQLTFLWQETPRVAFDGIEERFFLANVSQNRPYMRLLSSVGTPMTKLYQPSVDSAPVIHDANLLRLWVSEQPPVQNENFLFAKVDLGEYARSPLYGTVIAADDGTATFTVQPAKGVRSLQFDPDLANLGAAIEIAQEDMPFMNTHISLGRIYQSYVTRFDTRISKEVQEQIIARVRSFSTLFQEIPIPEDDFEAPFMALRYKGVDNFRNETRMASYLTYFLNRPGVKPGDEVRYVADLAREFEISEAAAREFLMEYIKNKGEFTMTDPEENKFIPTHNPGIDISITKIDAMRMAITIMNEQTIKVEDIQRICSILLFIMHFPEESWQSALEQIAATRALAERKAVPKTAATTAAAKSGKKGKGTAVLVELNEDATGGGAAAGASAAAGAVAEAEQPVARQAVPEKIVVVNWFIERLKQVDADLFGYKEDSSKGIQPYSKACPNNLDRYPIVLTPAEYQSMRRLYTQKESNGEVTFRVFGEKPSLPEKPVKGQVIQVLRYGSNPLQMNYYLCCDYFCLRDLVPVLNADWTKEAKCPFCGGLLITDRKNPRPNETVFKRINAPNPQSYIGFLKESKHPKENYELPCCFTKDNSVKLSWKSDKFKRIRDAQVPIKTAGQAQETEQEIMESVDYTILQRISKLQKEYINYPVKYPLAPGKIGRPNVAIDAYFGQTSQQMVEPVQSEQLLVAKTQGPYQVAKGMFRIGVPQRGEQPVWSLYSALAPALGKDGWRAVRKMLLDEMTPSLFLQLNFGNLVNEFFRPGDAELPPAKLAAWSNSAFDVDLYNTKHELSRVYRSYRRFMEEYLEGSALDPTEGKLQGTMQVKSLRHIAHFFAEVKQMNILVLEYHGDPSSSNVTVEVKCPLQGMNSERYANNDVVFITYNKGIWEPLMYIDRSAPDVGGYFAVTQLKMSEPNFPRVIRERYLEYLNQCQSTFRGAYTLERGIENGTLLPLTRAVDRLKPDGVVRDVYNHVVAVTVKLQKSNKLILVPCVDDGHLTTLPVYFGMQALDNKLASANEVEQFYDKLGRSLSAEGSLKLQKFMRTTQIVAFVIGSTVLVSGKPYVSFITMPCGPERVGEELHTEVKQVPEPRQFRFEYEINREIMFKTFVKEDEDLTAEQIEEKYQDEFVVSSEILDKEQIEEIYQHLRLTFSLYVDRGNPGAEGAKMRRDVEALLENNTVPVGEKRRLLILLWESTIRSWFMEDPAEFPPVESLVRKDCTSLAGPDCTGACVLDDGQCKIHTPAQIQVSSRRQVEAGHYFALRLFDELLRLPGRRQELLNKAVKRIQVPSKNIQIGDAHIYPENVPAWYELLRGEMTVPQGEQPVFYEEFSRAAYSSKELEMLSKVRSLFPLPLALQAMFSPKTERSLGLEVIASREIPPLTAFLKYFLNLMPREGVDTSKFDQQTLLSLSNRLKLPVAQIELQENEEEPSILAVSATLVRGPTPMVLLVPNFNEGPALVVLTVNGSFEVPFSLLPAKILSQIQSIVKKTVPKLAASSRKLTQQITRTIEKAELQQATADARVEEEAAAASVAAGGGAAEIPPLPPLPMQQAAQVQQEQQPPPKPAAKKYKKIQRKTGLEIMVYGIIQPDGQQLLFSNPDGLGEPIGRVEIIDGKLKPTYFKGV